MKDLTNIDTRATHPQKKSTDITSNIRRRANCHLSSQDHLIDDLATNILENSAHSKKSE